MDKAFALWGGPPLVLRMDNGPEFVSTVLQQFCRSDRYLLDLARDTVEQRTHRILIQPTAEGMPQPQSLDESARSEGRDRRLQGR
ncbi:integrase catalytic subunit [Rhodococcus wratislaviensis IFP 2016]|nr:integrase catalytic subunit [Rhodococcus wratislaviensis IFP 2016]